MTILGFCRSAFGICAAVAMLSGCGGSQPPIGASGAMPQTRTIAPHVESDASWMSPDAKSQDLLYISAWYGIHILSYPKGMPMGDLAVAGVGLCTDPAGDVFVTDPYARQVYEYAHGGTRRLKTLYDLYVDFTPFDCSVDPTTGNVAVASLDSGFVVIFPNAKNSPQVYDDPYAILFECAYDNKGNLYVDQVRHRGRQYIGVLAKGTTTFKNFLLDRRAGNAGSLQFDGQHIVVDDLLTNTLHQLRFSDSNVTVVGNTPLNGAGYIRQYWIQGRTVIGPDEYGPVYYWNYPGGGSPIYEIQAFAQPVGSTVSLAPR